MFTYAVSYGDDPSSLDMQALRVNPAKVEERKTLGGILEG